VALIQVTNLGVHARVGAEEGVVWVTGASDGAPRAGATATLYDDHGRVRAEAAARLGDRFDVRAFHDLVIGLGPVPLSVLDQQVTAWTASP